MSSLVRPTAPQDQTCQHLWLERAYRQRDIALIEIVGEPLLKGMADDPRFKAFLRKMKLPDDKWSS